MKIAAFPKCYLDAISVERSMSVFDWITDSQSLGADGLELYEGFFWSTEAGYVDSIGEALETAGTVMPMLCCSPDLAHPDAGVRRRAVDHEATMMGIARRLGGPGAACRVLTGQRHPGVPLQQGLDWAVEAINELLPLAHELDVVLALENHYKDGSWAYPELAQRREDFLHVLGRVPDRTHFGVQYDPSNALMAGDDPVALLRHVVDRVVTMQASDRYLRPGLSLQSLRQADGTLGYSPDLLHGVVGEGLNDYDEIFAVLAAAGYDGWVSIEDGVNGLDEMRRSVEFLRLMRDRHFHGSTAVLVRSLDESRAGVPVPS